MRDSAECSGRRFSQGREGSPLVNSASLEYFDIKAFEVHDLIQGTGRGKGCFPDVEFGARNQEILEAMDQSSRSETWVSTAKAP